MGVVGVWAIRPRHSEYTFRCGNVEYQGMRAYAKRLRVIIAVLPERGYILEKKDVRPEKYLILNA